MNDPIDPANLAELLRRQPRICTDCAATALALDLFRLLITVVELRRTIAIRQEAGPCPVCGQESWLLSTDTGTSPNETGS